MGDPRSVGQEGQPSSFTVGRVVCPEVNFLISTSQRLRKTISPVSCCHSQILESKISPKKIHPPKCFPATPSPPCYSTPRFPLTPTRRTSQRPTHASHACQWYNAKAWIHRAVEGDVVRWFSLVFQLAIS